MLWHLHFKSCGPWPVSHVNMFCSSPCAPVDRCFPLEQAVEGHDYLEAGKSRGKVLYEI